MRKTSSIVRTSRGVPLDINRLAKQNEYELAITGGGLSMNARGDILGKNGKIIKTREEFERAYNIENQNAAKHVTPRQISIKKPNLTPDDLSKKSSPVTKKESSATEEFSIEQLSQAMSNVDKRKRKTIEE